MNTLNIVAKIAYDVRYWAEGRAGNDMLDGWCAIASAELHRQLFNAGIKSEIHVWTCPKDGESSHVYLLVDDYIVDVTATQFRELKDCVVFIMHHREAEQYPYYRTVSTYKNVEALIAYQVKSGWPRDQIAFSKSACIAAVVPA